MDWTAFGIAALGMVGVGVAAYFAGRAVGRRSAKREGMSTGPEDVAPETDAAETAEDVKEQTDGEQTPSAEELAEDIDEQTGP